MNKFLKELFLKQYILCFVFVHPLNPFEILRKHFLKKEPHSILKQSIWALSDNNTSNRFLSCVPIFSFFEYAATDSTYTFYKTVLNYFIYREKSKIIYNSFVSIQCFCFKKEYYARKQWLLRGLIEISTVKVKILEIWWNEKVTGTWKREQCYIYKSKGWIVLIIMQF